MALTRFPGRSDVISQLTNQPNDNEGLSAAELKAKFDQFGETFKTFFNNTFIPEVENEIHAAASGIPPTTGLSGAIIVDGTIMAEKLSTTSPIQAVTTQAIRDAAVSKQKLSSEVQAIVDSVAGKTAHSSVAVVLAYNGWASNTQTVTATGVKTNNVVIATAGVDDTSHEAWSNCDIRAVEQGANTLTFKARTVPTDNVNVNILILD